MPATAIQSLISTAPAPAAAPAADVRSSGADGSATFDSHLDTARQQHASDRSTPTPTAHHDKTAQAARKSSVDHSDAGGQKKPDDSPATDAAAAESAKTASGADANDDTTATAATASSDGGQDDTAAADVSVAGAMLALLGQAMPANASAATGGAAKVMAASVLKASLGNAASAATAAVAPDATAPVAGDATTDATAAAVGQGGNNGVATFADLFASGLPKQLAARQDDAKSTDALAALLPATTQTATQTALVPTHTLSIASPVGSTDFTQQLGQQIAWLGNQDIKQARIRLHPEDLGSLDVKVSVQHTGQVDVSFAAQHPATVHALQQTLPQLDTLLAQQGLSLGQAHVGQQSNGGSGGGHGSSSAVGGDGSDAAIDDVAGVASAPVSALGLVDAFA